MLQRAKSFILRRKKKENESLDLPEASHLRRNKSINIPQNNEIEVINSQVLTTRRPRRTKSYLKQEKYQHVEKQTLNASEEFLYVPHFHQNNFSRSLQSDLNNTSSLPHEKSTKWFENEVLVDGNVQLRGKDIIKLEKCSTWCEDKNRTPHKFKDNIAFQQSKKLADEFKANPLLLNNKKSFKIEPTSTLKRMMDLNN